VGFDSRPFRWHVMRAPQWVLSPAEPGQNSQQEKLAVIEKSRTSGDPFRIFEEDI
jgi:hypothetical protein